MPMKDVPSLCNGPLAFGQDSCLPSHLIKSANDGLAAVHESIKCVWNPDFGAELLHQLLRSTKVMSWHPGEKMMNCLKLQAAVEEVEPLGAVDIHGCAQHLLREGLVWSEFRRTH